MSEKTTEQEKRVPNPTGKGGFGDNPQNRNPGGWDKTQSISYWYNKLGRMSDEELAAFVPSNQNQKIALIRIQRAAQDDKDALPEVKEITDRTEGKAPQFIGTGDKDDYDDAFSPLSTEDLRKLAYEQDTRTGKA